jgi:hypothetical protein
MLKKFCPILLLLFLLPFAATAFAQSTALPASASMKTFAGVCLRNIGDLEVLRKDLKAKGFPQLQETAARSFLNGHAGDAWPVPDAGSMGNLVLTLPTDHYECTVMARLGSTVQAEAEFVELMSKPQAPFVMGEQSDTHTAPGSSNDVHTLGYSWKIPGAPKALAFFLTTAAA